MNFRIRLKQQSRHFQNQAGLTLLEIILVIAVIAGVYAIALPQFDFVIDNEVSTRISRLEEDVRDAYDKAVLSGKPYRIVFMMSSGEYWLEVTNETEVFLGQEGLESDPTKEQLEEKIEDMNAQFEAYMDLAGDVVVDEENEKEINPTSPVIKAKDKLFPPKWEVVEDMEWGLRKLGETLVIMDIQAEHHRRKQERSDLDPKTPVYIHFFPKGYVEKSYIHIGYSDGDGGVDEEKEPYTLKIHPYTGHVKRTSGYEEIDLENDDKF